MKFPPPTHIKMKTGCNSIYLHSLTVLVLLYLLWNVANRSLCGLYHTQLPAGWKWLVPWAHLLIAQNVKWRSCSSQNLWDPPLSPIVLQAWPSKWRLGDVLSSPNPRLSQEAGRLGAPCSRTQSDTWLPKFWSLGVGSCHFLLSVLALLIVTTW